ncbi:helix-turn-helix domain-containing protein [Aliikangiella maris]|uniref:Helix-turn-helix domain-containing protein n=1 Tax=Aliikangiella maris TaxID=3162458 RepID=A0ABV3MNN9_9GAMM
MLGQRQKYVGYRNYVAQGVDEDISRFYNRGNYLTVLGDKAFKESVREETKEQNIEQLRKVLEDRPGGQRILELVAVIFKVKSRDIKSCPGGKRVSNPARAFAMYACQRYGAMSLKQIAVLFNLSHSGSVSFSVNKVKRELVEGQWLSEVKQLERGLYIVK